VQIAKCAHGKKSVTDWIQLVSAKQTFQEAQYGISNGEGGVHIRVLSLHVTGFWDVTSHTVGQICRHCGGIW